MKILAIETSCDETGVTIFEATGGVKNASFKILANNLSSQAKLHEQYGGVFPMMAKREHIKNLPLLLEKTLKEAKLLRQGLKSPVDLICVTSGPGLEPTLWTGITFAQDLAKKWKVKVVPVNHMEGHILSVFGKDKGTFKIPKINFPTLALLVSGGHTELVLIKKWMDYEVIGATLDDAVGEAFDKVARMLGLPYPGGPEISRLAGGKRKGGFGGGSQRDGARLQQFSSRKIAYPEKSAFSFPRPMLHTKNFDFSFSGLKTSVLYLIQKLGKLDSKTKAEIAFEFQNAAIECLTYKTAKAVEKYKIKTLIVAGGVAANAHLRNEIKLLAKNYKLKAANVLFPSPTLSTDNSIMIGIAGYLNYIKNKGRVPKKLKADGNLKL